MRQSVKLMETKPVQPPTAPQNEFSTFIDNLFAKKKQWKRYSNILTNDTKFDSNALRNKYIS